jgi:CRISPR-associated exonuclease Cas4
LRLGLVGKADVVEFHRLKESSSEEADGSGLAAGITLTGVKGLWQPFPVEYKVGRRRHEEGYEVQVCAQALCLEEMLKVAVPAGAIFYAKTGRRLELTFDERLRSRTEEAAAMLHEIIRSGKTPKARYEKKCDKCSLLSQCMPKTTGRKVSVGSYLEKAVAGMGRDTK